MEWIFDLKKEGKKWLHRPVLPSEHMIAKQPWGLTIDSCYYGKEQVLFLVRTVIRNGWFQNKNNAQCCINYLPGIKCIVDQVQNLTLISEQSVEKQVAKSKFSHSHKNTFRCIMRLDPYQNLYILLWKAGSGTGLPNVLLCVQSSSNIHYYYLLQNTINVLRHLYFLNCLKPTFLWM